MSQLNKIQPSFPDKKYWGNGLLYCFLGCFLGLFLTTTSCSNDHCSESMYAPLIISFRSEIDTSRSVAPAYMAIEGVNSLHFRNISAKDSIHLPLRKLEETSKFRFYTAIPESQQEIWTYVENRPNNQCPCENLSGTVPVYEYNGTEIFICSETNEEPMLFVYKNTTPTVFFLKGRETGTLSVYVPTEDVLSINYQNTQEFISGECGCLVTHRLNYMIFEQNGIGEIVIKAHSVSNRYDERHANIYLENY
jgi:hypothetical protein